jgi:hypothetical protein
MERLPGFDIFSAHRVLRSASRPMGSTRCAAPAHLAKVRALMNRLSRRMDAEMPWPAHARCIARALGKPRIPSGYTYLLQFVAHDLVHSAIPLSVAGGLVPAPRMRAARRFKLETLFGSGPVGSPFVYALDAPNDDRRTKLRLGRMRWKEKNVEPGCPFRDIARAPAENVTGIDRSIAGTARRPHRGAGRRSAQRRSRHHVAADRAVCAAAQRADRLVRRGEPAAGPNAAFGAAYTRFLCARGALTSIYHNIIRKDLMRRVLHPAIYAAYSARTPTSSIRPPFQQRFRCLGNEDEDGWQIPTSNSRTARFASATPWCGRISHQ